MLVTFPVCVPKIPTLLRAIRIVKNYMNLKKGQDTGFEKQWGIKSNNVVLDFAYVNGLLCVMDRQTIS